MCLHGALAKCKTEEQRQKVLAEYHALIAAAEAEAAGDDQAFCKMAGKHGAWAKHPDFPGMSFCCSCSTAYPDKAKADAELKEAIARG